MVFNIKGTNIILTAGDTGLFSITPREGGYCPTQDDLAVFTVREHTGGEKLIEKIIVPDENGKVAVGLINSDTKNIKPGKYIWDIRYALDGTIDDSGNIIPNGEVITPFIPSEFILVEAVGEV